MTLKEHQPAWLAKASRKKQIQADAISSYGGIYAIPRGFKLITDIGDVSELVRCTSSSRFSVQDVVQAYCHQAAIAHSKTNCLTEVLFNDAMVRARELDDYHSSHKKPVGPLHGVVMTLKDQFNVKGYDTTLGYVGRAFKPAQDDALLVTILKELGAIIIAKTNLPQSIMWCETENPLWGLTVNPMNPALTPGGSTGGESALLAQCGSMVGWGTDIGGSIRIPSHMLGLYGLKPSSGRLPYDGVAVSTEGQEHVPSVIGPLARSLASLHVVTKAVIDAEPWHQDSRTLPVPWREDVYRDIQTRPLVVGLLLDDGVVKVHPPLVKVLEDLVIKLKASGHEIVQWNADSHKECVEIMDLYYTADGGEDIKRDVMAGGEPFLPHVEALVSRAPAISVYEYWQLNKRKLAAQKAYLSKWSSLRSPETKRQVDVLITPTMPHPALPHRKCRWVGYTKVWNFLDYSALVLPAGKIDKATALPKNDPLIQDYVPRNELDRSNWALYDPELMHDLPLSIQIVGKRLEEEKVLGAAKVIEQILWN